MSEPFLAEIKIVGFNFPPRNWAQCDGQILPINQNQSLYSLLGTTYGGDGRTSFALPDLRGRTPIHFGQAPGGTMNHTQGQKSGEEANILTTNQIPNHTHVLRASTANASATGASGNVYARSVVDSYHAAGTNTNMRSQAVATTGTNQGHQTMQPYQALNFCIALQGLFPSRN